MSEDRPNQAPSPSYVERADIPLHGIDEIPLDEIRALMWYAAESGKFLDDGILKPLSEALDSYEKASPAERPALRGELLTRYAALAQQTAPVTGRTLWETGTRSGRHLQKLMSITLLVLCLAIANEGLANWIAERAVPEAGFERWLFEFRNSFLEFLSPFIWGALGACVYLMKRLYDFAKHREFDSRQLQGWGLRLLLGAILGAIVFHIYDIAVLGGGEGMLDADVLAFFTGVGVKVVYGAIERAVDGIAETINVGAIRRKPPQPREAKDLLTNMLAKTDPKAAPERQRAILDIIDELDRRA